MGTATKAKQAVNVSLSTAAGFTVGLLVQAQTVFAQIPGIIDPRDKPTATANNTDLRTGVVALINYFLGFLGLVAVIVIIFSGVKLVASQGNDAKIKEAQKTILYAALGLLIVFFAYAIVNFIVSIVV